MTTTDPVEHIRRWSDAFTDLRRDLHAHPELGFEEHRTARLVGDQLSSWSIEHHAGIGRTGIVAVVPGRVDKSGRRIGLRADMDALPMQEENDVTYRSRYDGADRGAMLHSSRYDFNDGVIPLGAGFLARIAERAMPLHA